MKDNFSIKYLLKKYSHIWTVSYVLLYMPWFIWLEKHVTTNYYVIHSKLDDVIPFCEYFIIPYYLWFAFILFGMIFLFFASKTDYYKACAFLFSGMTIFLLICTFWPNGQNLRLDISDRNNIFAKTVNSLYSTDTNTNVFPSIHVFNSIGVCIALFKTKLLKGHNIIKFAILLLTIAIILATMFLKQHSVIDVIGAIILGIILYIPVYVIDWKKIFSKKHTS